MKIALGAVTAKTSADVLAILVTEESLADHDLINAIDKQLSGAFRTALKSDEWIGKKDSQYVIQTLGNLPQKKIALVGLGPTKKLVLSDVRAATVRAVRWAQTEKATSIAIALHNDEDDTVQMASEGASLGTYRFTKYFTGDRIPKKPLQQVTIGLTKKPSKTSSAAFQIGLDVSNAVNFARDLVNEPPNELTPERLADESAAQAKKAGLTAKILDRKQIIAAGMHLLDAVGRGSTAEQRFIHLTYSPGKPRKGRKRVVLVGKGLTFDSGGLCIKQAQGMGDMKCDMAGAAVSIAAVLAVAALKLDLEVHAVVAAAENMPDGSAYRPGDVFGSLDGKTVEIVNTDAEGRLVLADALAYTLKLKPDIIIDHATLTGACVVALGTFTAGMYCNDEALAEQYLAAAKKSGESVWRMPLLEELRDGLKSDVADLKHMGDRWGGSIFAALFLREFIADHKWIHMDIAGPALLDRATAWSPKGGTGFGVLTLVEYLRNLV